MSLVVEPSPGNAASMGTPEDRFVLHGVPWQLYTALRDSLDASRPAVRLTYRNGDLELMSPSPEHEEARSVAGLLVVAYCEHLGIDAFAKGSTTYRNEVAGRGPEADESYSFGSYKTIPDLAIEVVYTSHRLDKLDVYRGLGVSEVWLFERSALSIHVLTPAGYVRSEVSRVLPELDVALLASFVRTGQSATRLVREYRAALASK